MREKLFKCFEGLLNVKLGVRTVTTARPGMKAQFFEKGEHYLHHSG